MLTRTTPEAVEAFLRFADFLPEAMLLVSANGMVLAANREARENLLTGAQDIGGRPLADFLDSPDSLTDYLRMCARSLRPLPGILRFRVGRNAVANGECRAAGWAVGSPDGSTGQVLLRLTPKAPAVSRFLALNEKIDQLTREISHRRRAERAANESRELWHVTLSSIGDAVITTDTNGNVTFMNPVAEAHTGWRMQDVLGRPLDDIFVIRNEDTREAVDSPVHKVLQTGLTVGLANHTVLIRKDGTELPIDDSGAPIRDAAGNIVGVVLVFHEIKERRRLERELRRQAEALREADKRKDDFLAMLGHELRNPLAPLHHCVELLRMHEQQPDGIGPLADIMERQTRQLSRLVDDLLDVSRISRGAIRLQKSPTSLAAVLRHAVETVQVIIDARQHTLNLSLPPESLRVNGDLARLSQVFCNLLTNAAKFMEPGGLITITATDEGDGSALVLVRDHGAGLSKELLPYVFDLFAQGDRQLDRSHGGLGIGLTLVKSLVTMHDGTVSAFSEGPGKGSEFAVRLPIALVDEQAADSHPPLQAKLQQDLLIVDDNVDAATTLAILLRAKGCRVRIAHDGTAAIHCARAEAPDAILLDLGLPGMDGFEAARRLRRLPGGKRALIIALTGYGSAADRERTREAGFDHHLTKPVALEELLRLLQQPRS